MTVGETPDFLVKGGAVDFVFDGDNLRFDVNLDAAGGSTLEDQFTNAGPGRARYEPSGSAEELTLSCP